MVQIKVNSRFASCIKLGQIVPIYNKKGDQFIKYQIDVRHVDLNKYKVFTATDLWILQDKIDVLVAGWDRQHEDQLQKRRTIASKASADKETQEATEQLEALHKILLHALKIDNRVDWSAMKDSAPFLMPNVFPDVTPTRRTVPKPYLVPASISFLDLLFGRKAKKIKDAAEANDQLMDEWRSQDAKIQEQFELQMKEWEHKKQQFHNDWAARKLRYEEEQASENSLVDKLSELWKLGDPQSVIEHATLVLESSDYGDLFEKSLEIDY